MSWIILLLLPLSSAETPGSSLKAYELAREKKWPEARAEALRATKSNPKDAKAWVVLGIVEERTENLSESVAAYKKYLALNSDSKAAAAIQSKMPVLKTRADKKDKDVWGNQSWGAFVGYSPSVQSQMADQLDSDFNKSMDLGFNFGAWHLGYRRATATIPKFKAPPKSTTTGTITYTTLTNGKQVMEELFVSGLIPMIDPYGRWGNAQLGLPLYFGVYSQAIRANSRIFSNVAYDLAAGLSVKWFTKSTFTFELSSIYHLAIPFWGVRETADSKTIRSMKDEDVMGRNTGLEVRVGIGFLFGATPTGHY